MDGGWWRFIEIGGCGWRMMEVAGDRGEWKLLKVGGF